MITANKKLFKDFAKEFIIWLAVFTVLFIPIGLGLNKLGNARIFSGDDQLMEDMVEDLERVNILVLGVNQGLSDTIMLGSYDMKQNKVDVISIPRDTYYDREDATTPATYKINSIYRKGTAVGTAKAVSDLLGGLDIHYYAVVDYAGIGQIVDSIGGVPMDIPFHMKYRDPTDRPPLYVDIPKGPTIINSGNVEQFLRYRQGSPGYPPGYPNGDIGRIEAHQKFIKSAFKESIGIGLPKVVRTTLRNVDSDITLNMALKMAGKTIGMSGDDMTTWLLPGKSGTQNKASYWWPDQEGIKAMMDEICSEPEDDNPEDENEEEE